MYGNKKREGSDYKSEVTCIACALFSSSFSAGERKRRRKGRNFLPQFSNWITIFYITFHDLISQCSSWNVCWLAQAASLIMYNRSNECTKAVLWREDKKW